MKKEMAVKARKALSSFRNKKAGGGHASLQRYNIDDSFTFSQFVLLTRSIIPDPNPQKATETLI